MKNIKKVSLRELSDIIARLPKTTVVVSVFAFSGKVLLYGYILFTFYLLLFTRLYASWTTNIIAGNGISGETTNGALATATCVSQPSGVAVDSAGNIYITVFFAISKVLFIPAQYYATRFGITSMQAGNIYVIGDCNNFTTPMGIAVDSSGRVYVGNTSSYVIKRINTDGTIQTYAGIGTCGNFNGTKATSQFMNPVGIAIYEDVSGLSVYVADMDDHSIRKISDSDDLVSYAAGKGSQGHLDSTALNSQFSFPWGIAISTISGVVTAYVSDGETGGSSICGHTIRKITTNVTTIAGQAGTAGYLGDGGLATSAKFNKPRGVAVDTSGNIYIADSGNNCVRKIDTSGYINTIATGLHSPRGIAVDSSGNIYVADYANNCVKKITYSNTAPTFTTTIPYTTGGTVSITPASGEIKINIPAFAFNNDFTITAMAITSLPMNQPGMTIFNVGIEINTSGLSPDQQSSKDISITMYYRDMDIISMGGVYDKSKLKIAYYDETPNQNRWIPITSMSYPSENKVVGTTRHFTKFALVFDQSSAINGLKNAYCYPVPARLSKGDIINFRQFTPNSKVRILSPAGYILKEFTADSNGNIPSWNGIADNNEKLGSGTYIVHASDDSSSRVFKIMIIK